MAAVLGYSYHWDARICTRFSLIKVGLEQCPLVGYCRSSAPRSQERSHSLLQWNAWSWILDSPGELTVILPCWRGTRRMLRWRVPADFCLLAIPVKNRQGKTHHKPSGTLKSLLMPQQIERPPWQALPDILNHPSIRWDEAVVVVSHYILGGFLWQIAISSTPLEESDDHTC